jgi:hypothetical protein
LSHLLLLNPAEMKQAVSRKSDCRVIQGHMHYPLY